MVRGVSWEDMGLYRCVAENEHGKDEASIFIYPVDNAHSQILREMHSSTQVLCGTIIFICIVIILYSVPHTEV